MKLTALFFKGGIMETRLLKYKKKNRRTKFILNLVLSSFIILLCSITILSKIPGTYAWFETKSTAVGVIQNAKTSDLVEIQVGNIKYIGQCKVKTSLSVKNISSTDIPIKIQLVNLDSKDKTVSDISLQGNSKYTTDPTMINLNKDQCSINNIEYRVIGYNGYINELIPIQLNLQKLQEPSTSLDKNQVNVNNVTPSPVQGIENNNKTDSKTVIDGTGPANTSSTVSIADPTNGQSSIGNATNGIQQAPPDSGTTINKSTSTSVDTSGNGSQTQGTESALTQP
jgi:hypothetical protein